MFLRINDAYSSLTPTFLGSQVNSVFYNIQPENSFEFFPSKDAGGVRPSPFLERSLPANLFPR